VGSHTATLRDNGYAYADGETILAGGEIQTDCWGLDIDDGTLSGHGTVNGRLLVRTGGTVLPGGSDRALRVTRTDLGPGSNLEIDVDGLSAGTEYDQFIVDERIDVQGVELYVSLNYAAAPGDSFTIIDNRGADAVSGTFAGLPEGAVVQVGNPSLQISYVGGDGNDVVVTAILDIEDFGDAPDPSYPTLLDSDGARHLATGPTLGVSRDIDSDGQPTAAADGARSVFAADVDGDGDTDVLLHR
jgi:hypothetical protein